MKRLTITIALQQYIADEPTKTTYQNYMQQLKKSIGDDEQLPDIEARIVELLDEMKIKPGDMVQSTHFKKVFTQLGGPQSFEDKPIIDVAQHQREIIMRTLGTVLVLLAIIIAIFTISSVAARDSSDDFPSGFAEWLYAIAGLLTVGFFVTGCVATGWGLMKTRFTAGNKKIVKMLAQGFVGSFVLIFVATFIIALTN